VALTEDEEFELLSLERERAMSHKQPQKPDWKQLVTNAAKDSFRVPARAMKNLATRPDQQANLMPFLMGTVGGISPIPGGATMGTMAGQGIRDLTLKTLNKPVPGIMQHGLELGGAAVGDIAAIPYVKGKIYGGQIGKAEEAAGILTRGPIKAVTPGSVGETLNNLEAQIDAGAINTPQAAQDAQAVMSQVYKNPKIYEQTSEISVQAQRVGEKVSKILNNPQMVPGRAVPNAAYSKAMTIPNQLEKVWKTVPWQLKLGLGIGGGVTPTVAAYQLIKKLLGGQQ